MRFGIIVFPGSNCDRDCENVVTRVLGHEAFFIWHRERKIEFADCLILPGGFSYGDYLRSGAMAARSLVMNSVKKFAEAGGLVIGICNGFQILQEAGLLPGALMRNDSLKFVCRDVFVRVERADTPFTCACKPGEVLKMPVAHMDGNFFLEPRSARHLMGNGGVLFRYCGENGEIGDEFNPNGSQFAIAGALSEKGNVLGLMPHPERSSETILGNRDGIKIFESIVKFFNKGER